MNTINTTSWGVNIRFTPRPSVWQIKMNCPYCGSKETKVIDSRESKDGTYIKRRRECNTCEKRFSTAEKVLKLDLEVKKNDGRIEEFNIQKIKKGILKALDKRPVTLEQVEIILEKVLADLKKVKEDVIPTDSIGKIVLIHLKDFDEIGFLKFAIVHNDYSSIGDFLKEIDTLKSFEGIDYKSKN